MTRVDLLWLALAVHAVVALLGVFLRDPWTMSAGAMGVAWDVRAVLLLEEFDRYRKSASTGPGPSKMPARGHKPLR